MECEYEITAKPITSDHYIFNTVLERIHQIIGNLVQTCNITQPMLMKITHGQTFYLQQRFYLSQQTIG